MAALDNTQALVNDALFRAGEIPGSSEWDAKALDYINREYRALCSGASEFLPEYVHDWWWMRATGVLTMLPVVGGTVAVTQANANIVFPVPYTTSMEGRRMKFTGSGNPDNYVVASHVAGSVNAVLDSVYNGPTDTSINFQAFKTTYQLDTAVASLMSPIISFRDNPQIMGLSPERMDQLFPVVNLVSGVPMAFCLENEQTIRFSAGGREDGVAMRMEYRYRPMVTDLINNSSSIPLVPLQFRHVLADMALVYIMLDKNDDRSTFVGTSTRSTLGAMVKENLRRMVKMDQHAGAIRTRPNRNTYGFTRTAGGLYIR